MHYIEYNGVHEGVLLCTILSIMVYIVLCLCFFLFLLFPNAINLFS